MTRIAATIAIALMLAPVIDAKIDLPVPTEFSLDNGVQVYVIERHSLPLFSLAVVFRAGSIYDPDDKHGLANLCNDLLLRGTEQRSAKDIADEVSFGGGQLSTYCDKEDAGLWGEFMADYEKTCFEIIGDILRNSRFAQEELDKSREKIKGYLQSRFDDPRMLANEMIEKEILGDNPYAHNAAGTIEDLNAITRTDITEFFDRQYTPENCLIVICGDIDADTVKTRLETYLGGWKKQSNRVPVAADFDKLDSSAVLIVDKPDATQTQIRVGGIGIRIDADDYIPVKMAGSVLAGSFMSRLTNEIRVNRGLAYMVSLNDRNYDPGGVIYVSTSTRNETAGEVLDIIFRESRRMQTEPVPDSELTAAQNYRCGTYPLDFETNDDLLAPYIKMWLYGLTPAFFEDFQERLRRTGPDEVMAAAEQYFPDSTSRIVLIGPAEILRPQVSAYSSIRVIALEDL